MVIGQNPPATKIITYTACLFSLKASRNGYLHVHVLKAWVHVIADHVHRDAGSFGTASIISDSEKIMGTVMVESSNVYMGTACNRCTIK